MITKTQRMQLKLDRLYLKWLDLQPVKPTGEQDFKAWLDAHPDAIERLMAKPKAGRPHSGKKVVTLRLDPEVIAKFKATGDGWQARMNDALKAAIVQHRETRS